MHSAQSKHRDECMGERTDTPDPSPPRRTGPPIRHSSFVFPPPNCHVTQRSPSLQHVRLHLCALFITRPANSGNISTYGPKPKHRPGSSSSFHCLAHRSLPSLLWFRRTGSSSVVLLLAYAAAISTLTRAKTSPGTRIATEVSRCPYLCVPYLK